jgi:hypothetical protein
MTVREAIGERSAAGRPYLLSIWLPFAPYAIVAGFAGSQYSVCWGPAAVLLGGLLLLLLPGITTRSAFVRWHTAQWALLTLPLFIYFGVAWVIGSQPTCELAVASTLLWWLLMFVGRGQANGGECWLWKLIRPSAEPPRPWPQISTAAASRPAPAPTPPRVSDPSFHVFELPNVAYRQGCGLRDLGRKKDAAQCYLQAFREGEPELRRQAVARLEELGEVEVF